MHKADVVKAAVAGVVIAGAGAFWLLGGSDEGDSSITPSQAEAVPMDTEQPKGGKSRGKKKPPPPPPARINEDIG